MMPPGKAGMHGFTLIEVLIALALFAICVTGLFDALISSTRLLNQTNLLESARNLATARLEYVKTTEYDVTSSDAVLLTEYQPAVGDAISARYPGFTEDVKTIRMHAVGSSTTEDEGVQKITITVSQGSKTLTVLEGFKANW